MGHDFTSGRERGRCCCVRNGLFTDAQEEQTGLLKRNPRSLTQWLIYMPPCTPPPSYKPQTRHSASRLLSLRAFVEQPRTSATRVTPPPTTHDGRVTVLLDPTYSVGCTTLDRKTNDFCTP
jgi:hypothetical protein